MDLTRPTLLRILRPDKVQQTPTVPPVLRCGAAYQVGDTDTHRTAPASPGLYTPSGTDGELVKDPTRGTIRVATLADLKTNNLSLPDLITYAGLRSAVYAQKEAGSAEAPCAKRPRHRMVSPTNRQARPYPEEGAARYDLNYNRFGRSGTIEANEITVDVSALAGEHTVGDAGNYVGNAYGNCELRFFDPSQHDRTLRTQILPNCPTKPHRAIRRDKHYVVRTQLFTWTEIQTGASRVVEIETKRKSDTQDRQFRTIAVKTAGLQSPCEPEGAQAPGIPYPGTTVVFVGLGPRGADGNTGDLHLTFSRTAPQPPPAAPPSRR